MKTRRAGPHIVAAQVPGAIAIDRSPPGSRTRTGAPYVKWPAAHAAEAAVKRGPDADFGHVANQAINGLI